MSRPGSTLYNLEAKAVNSLVPLFKEGRLFQGSQGRQDREHGYMQRELRNVYT